jgi:hypothetical protein
VNRQGAARARASKDKDSPALDAIIEELIREKIPNWNRRAPNAIAAKIYDEVIKVIKSRNLHASSKREIGQDAIRKRVAKIIKSWKTG